jgi:hypothetical protein
LSVSVIFSSTHGSFQLKPAIPHIDFLTKAAIIQFAKLLANDTPACGGQPAKQARPPLCFNGHLSAHLPVINQAAIV